jgi:hypothetical protein
MRIWVVAACLIAGCTTTMRISRDELQADVAKRFPRDIDKLVVAVHASEPQIDFPGPPDVLGIRMHVEASTRHHHSTGSARVEGRIEYDASQHAFFLRDPHVTDLTVDPPVLDQVARVAIVEMLERHPIYRLDERRSQREAKAIRHLRAAHIDGRDLVLTVGLLARCSKATSFRPRAILRGIEHRDTETQRSEKEIG